MHKAEARYSFNKTCAMNADAYYEGESVNRTQMEVKQL
jgi:hypothetical protein